MKFKDYHQIKLDEILDKILVNGISSLSNFEIEFLDAFSQNDTMKMIMLEYESRLKLFKSSDGNFEFTFSHLELDLEGEKVYFGTIKVPDLSLNSAEKITGVINGYIKVTHTNDKIPYFEKEGYDILEFCNGLEYEFDNFLDYVIDTLNDEKNSF